MTCDEQEHQNINLKDGICIAEGKFSILAALTIIDFIYVLVKGHIDGDVTDNHVLIFQTLICAIAGTNIADSIGKIVSKKPSIPSKLSR